MKKYFVIVLLILSLIGCTNMELDKETKVNTLCIDGITYIYIKEFDGYHGWGYMSVKLNQNSKVILCDDGIQTK